jgi:hypothetical protein
MEIESLSPYSQKLATRQYFYPLYMHFPLIFLSACRSQNIYSLEGFLLYSYVHFSVLSYVIYVCVYIYIHPLHINLVDFSIIITIIMKVFKV